MAVGEGSSGANFETTNWSIVEDLRAGDEARRKAALEHIARVYWSPVYAYLRARGLDAERAAEITQGFFAEVVVGRSLVESATGGRLRALILGALRNYRIDVARRERAHAGALSIDLEHAEALCDGNGDSRPDEAFERQWDAAEVREAVRRTEAYCREHDLARHWAAFEARDLHPACGGVEPPPLAELAARHGFGGAPEVAAALQVVRRRLRLFLVQVRGEGEDPRR